MQSWQGVKVSPQANIMVMWTLRKLTAGALGKANKRTQGEADLLWLRPGGSVPGQMTTYPQTDIVYVNGR